MQFQWEPIEIIVIIVLAIPGLVGFIWSILNWRQERRLQSEQFMPRLDISFISNCYKKELKAYVAGTLVIENMGDLTTEIQNFQIQVVAEGNLKICDVRFYRDRYDPLKTVEFFIDPAEKSAEIEYPPKNFGKWFIIEPNRKFFIPLLICYKEEGNGNFIVHCTITAALTKRLSLTARHNYTRDIIAIEKSVQHQLDLDFESHRKIFNFYKVVYETYMFLKEWRPRKAYPEDFIIILVNELDSLMSDILAFREEFTHAEMTKELDKVLESYHTFYNLIQKEMAKEAEEFIDFETIKGSYNELVERLGQITGEIEIAIKLIMKAEGRTKDPDKLEKLSQLRFAIIKDDRHTIKQNLTDLRTIFEEKENALIAKKETMSEIEININETGLKATQRRINQEIQKLGYKELNEVNYLTEVDREQFIELTFEWEFWKETTLLHIKYRETYEARIKKFAAKELYETDEIFYVSTPEALEEARTITDFEFKYKIIQQESEKYLHGQLIITNKRNVKTRYQGMKLQLEQIQGRPSIQFFNDKTGIYGNELDLLQLPTIQQWIRIEEGHLPYYGLQKVRAVTFPYLIENIDFIVKIHGVGFFKLVAELVSAPVLSDSEFYYKLDLSGKNSEEFVGNVSSFEDISGEILESQFQTLPKSLTQPKIASTPLKRTSSSLSTDTLKKDTRHSTESTDHFIGKALQSSVIDGKPTFGDPKDRQIRMQCNNCGAIYVVDSKCSSTCSHCHSNLEEIP